MAKQIAKVRAHGRARAYAHRRARTRRAAVDPRKPARAPGNVRTEVGAVRVSESFRGSVHEAETCWNDTSRWPQWVDELAHVVSVEGDWPRQGAVVRWQSGPAGRGRVTERVIEHEPLQGYTVEVEDDSITGEQSVVFDPAEDGVEVTLALNYRIKRRSPLTPLVDVLFVRRLMITSLEKTLGGFGAVLAESRRSGVG